MRVVEHLGWSAPEVKLTAKGFLHCLEIMGCEKDETRLLSLLGKIDAVWQEALLETEACKGM